LTEEKSFTIGVDSGIKAHSILINFLLKKRFYGKKEKIDHSLEIEFCRLKFDNFLNYLKMRF